MWDIYIFAIWNIFSIIAIYGEASLPCPVGWAELKQNCYYPGIRKKWEEAKQECFSMNSSLIVIHSEEENSEIATLMCNMNLTQAWLGGQIFPNQTFQWFNGEAVHFIPWSADKVFNLEELECTQLICKSGVWRNVRCFLKKDFMCVRAAKNVQALTHGAGKSTI